MELDHDQLVEDVGLCGTKISSHGQLKRILKALDWESLNSINVLYMGKKIKSSEANWQAVDGKELRGTIDKAKGVVKIWHNWLAIKTNKLVSLMRQLASQLFSLIQSE